MNKTKAIAAQFVIFIALSLFGAVSLSAQTGPPMASKLDEYLNAATKQGFIGSVLVARDGKVIFSKGYGMANIEWDIPNTPQTKFRLGSITKQFTAASILLLQERGKLSVQDPICKHVADCPKAWEPVTIHHLLTHTSGIGSPTGVRAPMTPVTVAELVDSLKPKPLEFPVGEKRICSRGTKRYFATSCSRQNREKR
jgi:CubicO group peptidase (beta-lactamase class C family)